MNVTEYTFVSPYPNSVQVGRADPSSTKEAGLQTAEDTPLSNASNQTLSEAKQVEETLKNDVKPTVSGATSSNLLDIYA